MGHLAIEITLGQRATALSAQMKNSVYLTYLQALTLDWSGLKKHDDWHSSAAKDINGENRKGKIPFGHA